MGGRTNPSPSLQQGSSFGHDNNGEPELIAQFQVVFVRLQLALPKTAEGFQNGDNAQAFSVIFGTKLSFFSILRKKNGSENAEPEGTAKSEALCSARPRGGNSSRQSCSSSQR